MGNQQVCRRRGVQAIEEDVFLGIRHYRVTLLTQTVAAVASGVGRVGDAVERAVQDHGLEHIQHPDHLYGDAERNRQRGHVIRQSAVVIEHASVHRLFVAVTLIRVVGSPIERRHVQNEELLPAVLIEDRHVVGDVVDDHLRVFLSPAEEVIATDPYNG